MILPRLSIPIALLVCLGLLLTPSTDAATKRRTKQTHTKQPIKKQLGSPFRQPVYITNAYFSDQIAEGKEGAIQPLSVVKALKNRPSGPLGYLILDLMLVTPGTHTLRIDIINQQGKQVDTLRYPPITTAKQDAFPLYTATNPISGTYSAGLWFFKLFDQINNGTWYAVDTFSIVVLDTEQAAPTP